MPAVSVVIPTRDGGQMLKQSLGSVLQQEVDLEVVVMGPRLPGWPQGSACPGGTRHRTPLGVARARNAGIGLVRGDVIAFVDDDDLWFAHKLRTQARYDSRLAFDSCSTAIRSIGPTC